MTYTMQYIYIGEINAIYRTELLVIEPLNIVIKKFTLSFHVHKQLESTMLQQILKENGSLTN